MNDIQISKKNSKFISCSNDKTIKIWEIPEFQSNNYNNIETHYAALDLNNYHTDYIKGIAYSEKSGNLFTAGYDGKILLMKLDDSLKSPVECFTLNDSNSGVNNSSIFAIDCDLTGDLMIASVYENVKIYNF